MLAPNWLIERIAEQQPDSLPQLAEIQGIRRWQQELWGEELIEILKKEVLTV